MRRYALVLIVALMIIAPLAISRLGYPLALEKPTQAQEKSKKDKSKKDKDAQSQEETKVEKPAQAQEQPKGDVAAGDAAAGKALYTQFCQKCHAPGGEGVAKMYKLVKAKIVHLGSKEAQDKSDDFIRKSMTVGCCAPTNKMEKVTEPRPLTSQEVDAILAFVRTLKQ
jgi:mono/diheme cytochrome c family protein